MTQTPPQPMTLDSAEELRKMKRRWERERNARLEAESIAERGLRELYERKEQLQLLEAIAVAANQSATVHDALQFAMTKICQSAGWPLGHAYMVAMGEEGKRLHSTAIWHGHEAESMGAFRRATEATDFDPSIGLPGRVMATGEPAWIADVSEDCNFPRTEAARLAGIRAAFAFPVMVGSEVAAVLEFFTERAETPDEAFLPLMAQIGTQLGRVVERRRTEDRLIHDASHDSLTGLPNRALFLDRLAHAVARNRRHPQAEFAVLFIDLDRFKLVNDSLGHQAGDELILQVAARLSTSLRVEDLVARSSVPAAGDFEMLARLGGDEFTVLLDDLGGLSDAVKVAERILRTLEAPFSIDDHEVYASASIGIASSASGYTSADEALRDADLAMYRAKALGKARYEIFDRNMYAMAVGKLEMETNLRHAIENEEFVLHYQPIVALDRAEVVGFEALVRWRKSESELVYPGEFIQAAEDTGLIVPLGMWVLREGCRTMRKWQEEFPRERPLTVSVNLSARQFTQPDLVQKIRQIVADTGIDPRTVKLEITESVTMDNAERTISVLSQLRELGIGFSIDDFGTGFSSLSYLHRFPLDVLKIDRSFISRMEKDSDGLAIVQTIMNLARDLGMEVVAEGTETEAQVAQLGLLGCGFAQGYFFSKPLAEPSIREMLRTPGCDATAAAIKG